MRVAEEGDNRKPGEVQGGALGCGGGMGSEGLSTGSQLSSRVSIEAGRGRRGLQAGHRCGWGAGSRGAQGEQRLRSETRGGLWSGDEREHVSTGKA